MKLCNNGSKPCCSSGQYYSDVFEHCVGCREECPREKQHTHECQLHCSVTSFQAAAETTEMQQTHAFSPSYPYTSTYFLIPISLIAILLTILTFLCSCVFCMYWRCKNLTKNNDQQMDTELESFQASIQRDSLMSHDHFSKTTECATDQRTFEYVAPSMPKHPSMSTHPSTPIHPSTLTHLSTPKHPSTPTHPNTTVHPSTTAQNRRSIYTDTSTYPPMTADVATQTYISTHRVTATQSHIAIQAGIPTQSDMPTQRDTPTQPCMPVQPDTQPEIHIPTHPSTPTSPSITTQPHMSTHPDNPTHSKTAEPQARGDLQLPVENAPDIEQSRVTIDGGDKNNTRVSVPLAPDPEASEDMEKLRKFLPFVEIRNIDALSDETSLKLRVGEPHTDEGQDSTTAKHVSLCANQQSHPNAKHVPLRDTQESRSTAKHVSLRDSQEGSKKAKHVSMRDTQADSSVAKQLPQPDYQGILGKKSANESTHKKVALPVKQDNSIQRQHLQINAEYGKDAKTRAISQSYVTSEEHFVSESLTVPVQESMTHPARFIADFQLPYLDDETAKKLREQRLNHPDAPIYAKITTLEFVKGFRSDGNSIHVLIDFHTTDRHWALAELVHATGADATKFHMRDYRI